MYVPSARGHEVCMFEHMLIIESTSISRDEPDSP